MDLLLPLPAPILEGVEHHFVPEVESWVHVEGNVTAFHLRTLQVDMEPAEVDIEQDIETFRHRFFSLRYSGPCVPSLLLTTGGCSW